MNSPCGLKGYWKGRIKPLFYLFVLQVLFIQLEAAEEAICAEGILFGAELQCVMVAPERRMKVEVHPQMLFLSDSLVQISQKYPALLWVENSGNWKELIGKHVRLTGTIQEFFPGEFLVHPEQILACDSTPEEPRRPVDLTEEELCDLEEQIPLMANAAFRQESLRVLFQGFDVVQSHDNALWTIHPDGTETFIKELPPRFKVEPGRIIDIDSMRK